MSDLKEKCLAKVAKDSLVMRHELLADEDAVFTRLAKISNALRVAIENANDELLLAIAKELGAGK